MSTSGPWVSATPVSRSGDIWNVEVPFFTGSLAVSGGGTPTATGVKVVHASVTITGGGALAEAGTKKAAATVTVGAGVYGVLTYGDPSYEYGYRPLDITGGGDLTETAGLVRGGPITITGGGAPAEAAAKKAVATVVSTSYGPATYGGSSHYGDYSPSLGLSGGGALTETGIVVRKGLAVLSGGGTLTAAAVCIRREPATLSGGDVDSVAATKFTHATFITSTPPSQYGQAQYGTGTYLGLTLNLPLPGGGSPTEIAVKQAICTVTLGAGIYGVLTYGSPDYGYIYAPFDITGGGSVSVTTKAIRRSAIAITGGGALTATGYRTATATDVLSGGGSLTAQDFTARPGQINLSGGDVSVFIAAKRAIATITTSTYGSGTYGPSTYGFSPILAINGGGAPTSTTRKCAIATVAECYGDIIYGQGTYGLSLTLPISGGGSTSGSGIEHAQIAFTLTGGGDLDTLAAKATSTVILITGGGSLAAAIIKHAASGPLLLTGGGHLWGPYPNVLNPAIRITRGESRVLIRTGAGATLILAKSVRTPVPVP